MKNLDPNVVIFSCMLGTFGILLVLSGATHSYIQYKQYKLFQSAQESYNSCRALVAKQNGFIDMACGKLPKIEDFKP